MTSRTRAPARTSALHRVWNFGPCAEDCSDSCMPGPKHEPEFRDPIHTFIRVSSDERRIIDSRPFQRLRHIHQLALTYLVYPGATHRRFEHCLGVMDLAGRVFDVVTRHEHRHPDVRHIFPPSDHITYWRRRARMRTLCN